MSLPILLSSPATDLMPPLWWKAGWTLALKCLPRLRATLPTRSSEVDSIVLRRSTISSRSSGPKRAKISAALALSR